MEMSGEFDPLLFFEHARRTAEANYVKNPFDADNLTRWGEVLLELSQSQNAPESKKMVQDAIDKLEEALVVNPIKHEALRCLGNAYTSNAFLIPDFDEVKGYHDKATKCFKKACELEPQKDLYMKSLEVAPVCFRMSENKEVLGLSWQPQLTLLPSTGRDKCSQTETSALYKPNSQLIDGLFLPPNDPRKLNKMSKKKVKDTTGKNWFDMPAQTITPELKRDLQILKLRSAIDPKRHYKKGDSRSKTLPKYFQMGTVIESASEFFSGRLTKKERKSSLADELLSDGTLGAYRKRKVREIEEVNRPAGVDKWKNRKSRKHGEAGKSYGKKRRHY